MTVPDRPVELPLRGRLGPEEPFLFFRGLRGHLEWIPYRVITEPPGGKRPPLPGDVERFVARVRSGLPSASTGVTRICGAAGAERDIWLSWRGEPHPVEDAVLAWAWESGAAILYEPAERLPAELAIWARPTVLQGPPADLAHWLDRFEEERPRRAGPRWAERRLGRLRRLLVEEAEAGVESVRLAARLRALAPACPAVVVPVEGDALV
ncbi:MAG: hypothetical protein AB7G12_03715 [Thermoanaerobaculia bacterium]